MTNEEAKHKLDFLKKAYQKLIDEKVDSGKLVGDGVRGEWEAETPLDEVYKDMIESLDFAIKALDQQPCDDCISREALDDAISELTYWHFENDRLITGGGGNKSETVYKVDDVTRLTHILPPVTPQQTRWIPCSERLPEDNKHVLCQFTLSGMGECYLAHGVFHVVGGLVMTCNEVIAWMPLPELYKESEEEG